MDNKAYLEANASPQQMIQWRAYPTIRCCNKHALFITDHKTKHNPSK